MRNIAPEITRQRLLIEGYYEINVTHDMVEQYLLEVARYLELRAYERPHVFSPSDKGNRKIRAMMHSCRLLIRESQFTFGRLKSFSRLYSLPVKNLTSMMP